MSSGQKTMTLFVTVILGLIFVILGLSSRWPFWAWPGAAAILLAISVVTHKMLERRPDTTTPGPLLVPDVLFPDERPEQRVSDVALPSAVPDYDFAFSGTVVWTVLAAAEDAPAINAAGLAVDAVLQRARPITAGHQPIRAAFVQHLLDGALGTMRPDATGRVAAMVKDVSLTLPELDRERLFRLSNVRKDEDLWEHERKYERSKRSYLGSDVLKDTGSAVVWWLSRNEDEIDGAVDKIGALAQLSAAANNDEVAPPFEHLVPPPPFGPASSTFAASEENGFVMGASEPMAFDDAASTDGKIGSVDEFLSWLGFSADDPDLDLFIERFIALARAHEKSDIADKLRRRFPPDDADSDDDSDD